MFVLQTGTMIKYTVDMRGSLVDLQTIIHAEFDLQTLYPCPHLDELGESLDYDWSDWCRIHWGTTAIWSLVMTYDDVNGLLHGTFVSESAPLGFFMHLKERFPSLSISLKEI